MNKELSDKFRIAGFICTIMVLYRHSLNYLAFFNSWTGQGINKIIQGNFLVFTEIAVPYFFIVSGLFFFNHSYHSIDSYKIMIKKKFKSLFIPFIIWNIFGLLILLVISDYDKIGDSLYTCIGNLLYSRWNGPLWYIRDLMIMMIFVWIYNWIFIVNKIWLFGFFIMVFYYYWIPVDISLISSEGIFFFFIGGLISKYNNVLNIKFPTYLTLGLVLLWICLSINTIITDNIYIHRCNTLIGLCSFWQILNFVPVKIKDFVLKYSSYSFLIYVMHSYLIKILKNSIAYIFYGNELIALITFIFLPIIVTFIIVTIGYYWKNISVKTYNIATGNR